MATKVEEARGEINATLSLCLFCMRWIGLSFDPPANARAYMRQKLMFIVSVCAIVYHVFSEIVYIGLTVSNSPRVEDVVPLFHTFGYGALRYFAMNMGGVLFYNVTPICVYFYELWIGQNAKVGFVWVSWYPFDKYQPINHIFVYIFEIFAGQTCVWIMLCTDLLFSGLASHIALLLRLLHSRLETLAETEKTNEEYYQEIIGNIKLHQRLIRYCNDLEEAFTIVNLVNVVLSSVNICCVVFVIVLLEPFVAVSNKLFLGAALIQIGMLCWYADDIFHSNAEVALAVYKSGWYRTDPRCRRALIFLIRSAESSSREGSSTSKDYDNVKTNIKSQWSQKASLRNFWSKIYQYEHLGNLLNEEFIVLKPKDSVHLPMLLPYEAEFLRLVTEDNVSSVQTYLREHPGLNVNCVNYQGVSALHIAVKNRSEAMVEFLLKQPNIEIGDTIMHAVRENNIKILVKLLDTQKEICPGLEFAGSTHSPNFPEHVTPLILAAQSGNYEAVALLVQRGHTIPAPHLPNCLCADCKSVNSIP
ncbi:hypothetical protein MSG28_000298 [Choristoneura fumiferana]|uniref:Uncharacterized protein n=1 Tax=Choristoneura fumiferana TaxID=7141 RepID=A0ACC0JZY4_CHOFU|nr:hypothetical protein MSG28_000298 [Choristoneura fumiferana]